MSGLIPSGFKSPANDDLSMRYATAEVRHILKTLEKAHDVQFAPWVQDYAVFHWVHADIISHFDCQFVGADSIRVLEVTLRSCDICAAQQGHFRDKERIFGFVRSDS